MEKALVPSQIGTASNWSSISAGRVETIGIQKDGTMWVWGENNHFILGNGVYEFIHSPRPFLKPSGWASVSVGAYHGAGIRTDGTIWSWGHSLLGVVMEGGELVYPGAKLTSGSSASGWSSVASGIEITIGIRSDGSLWMWDYDLGSHYAPGSEDITHWTRTVPRSLGSGPWSDLFAGWDHRGAIRKDGSLWVWGENHYGQIGDGTRESREKPVPVESSAAWSQVDCGWNHTVGILNDGSLWAWGNNEFGQLGDGTTGVRIVPFRIGTSTDWSLVSAGDFHTLAIKKDGSLWSWGLNRDGQLGDGSTRGKLSPVRIGTESDWISISAGTGHSVAIRKDGTLWGWGRNRSSQLGFGPKSRPEEN